MSKSCKKQTGCASPATRRRISIGSTFCNSSRASIAKSNLSHNWKKRDTAATMHVVTPSTCTPCSRAMCCKAAHIQRGNRSVCQRLDASAQQISRYTAKVPASNKQCASRQQRFAGNYNLRSRARSRLILMESAQTETRCANATTLASFWQSPGACATDAALRGNANPIVQGDCKRNTNKIWGCNRNHPKMPGNGALPTLQSPRFRLAGRRTQALHKTPSVPGCSHAETSRPTCLQCANRHDQNG